MIRAMQAGHFHAPVADTVVLDHEARCRRRGMLKTVSGLDFLVDLAETPALGRGDGYLLEDGRLIEIVASPEELLEVRGRDSLHTARVAYHLGNRHLECEISAKFIRIRRDHVIADMLRGLGAKVIEVEAPFHPEGGAYHQAGSEHSHHDHAHHDHKNDHKHGNDCGCEHDHSHDHGH